MTRAAKKRKPTGTSNEIERPALLDAFGRVRETVEATLEGLDDGSLPVRRDQDLDRVIDTRWTPPVTVGVRLVSTVADCLQHIGQSAYVKGLQGKPAE